MSNLLLNLKIRFNTVFGKIFIIFTTIYVLGYFNIYIYSSEEPNMYLFSLSLFETSKTVLFFFSILFLILIYNTFFDDDFNEIYIMKFKSRWKWFLSILKLIIVQAILFVVFILFVAFCLSVFSLDMTNSWTSEFIANSFTEVNVNLYNSMSSVSPMIVLIIASLNMITFLSALGIIFINLLVIIKRKDFVISIIYGYLLFEGIAVFYSPLKKFSLLANAKLIDYYVNKEVYLFVIDRFIYFGLIIIIGMLFGNYLCRKVDFSKSKRQ